MLRTLRATVSIPITLKFRAGWDDTMLNYVETAQLAEAAGVSALVLHPRTKAQGYSGVSDWTRVTEVKQAVKIPVLGSGDVKDAHDALDRLRVYGADGVMIGRAAMANPWIFKQTAQLRAGEPVFQPQPSDKAWFLLTYQTMLLEAMPEHKAVGKLKQLIGQFYVGLPHATDLRRDVQHARTSTEQRTIIERFFAQYADGQAVELVPDEAHEFADAFVEA
jgi:tRNA-dihydrouridine synthase